MTMLPRLALLAAIATQSACALQDAPPMAEPVMPEPVMEAPGPAPEKTELALLCLPERSGAGPGNGPGPATDDGIGGTGCPAL